VAPPDLPGKAQGLDPAYLSFPRTLVKTVSAPPAAGGEFNVLTQTFYPPPTPMEQNQAWQQVNRNLGTTLRLNIVSSPDYQVKFSTTVSGGNLPDALLFGQGQGQGMPNLPEFLKAQCQDLTPYLAGDAIKDHPNLANIPTFSWRGSVFNGTLYALPIIQSRLFATRFIRQDWMDEAGLGMPSNADEFKRVMQALTRPNENRWGMAVAAGLAGGTTFGETGYGFFPMMFRAPNNWAVDADGKFTKDIETDEYKQALAYEADLFKTGVFHPSSVSYTALQTGNDFSAGKYAMVSTLWNLYPYFSDRTEGKLSYVLPFSADGGKPVYYTSQGNFGLFLLKKSSDTRIKELLRVFDYLAAPFGSVENVQNRYGVKDVHYTLDPNGTPVVTQQGMADLPANGPWNLLGQPPVFYSETHSAEYGRAMYDSARVAIAAGMDDPTVGLYSATDASKRVTLARMISDKQAAIIFGRSSIAEWDQLVKDWRAGGGDQARTEYQQAYAAVR
jgi:putative aldouronate transport system substrate-binding protein